MSLTPEQFNKLATKEDLNEVKRDLGDLREDVGEFQKQSLDSLDKISKKLDDIEHAFVSNQAAHDRFEKRLHRIEKYLNLNESINE